MLYKYIYIYIYITQSYPASFLLVNNFEILIKKVIQRRVYHIKILQNQKFSFLCAVSYRTQNSEDVFIIDQVLLKRAANNNNWLPNFILFFKQPEIISRPPLFIVIIIYITLIIYNFRFLIFKQICTINIIHKRFTFYFSFNSTYYNFLLP